MVVNVGTQRGSLYYCSAYPKDKSKEDQMGKAYVKGGSIFVGGNPELTGNKIFQKKNEAQKQATKTVLDQFMRDQQTDDTLNHCKDQLGEFQKELMETHKMIDDIESEQNELAKSYDVPEDGEEAKNLELVRKSLSDPDSLSQEEKDQLSNMGPLTEYQKSALELDGVKEVYQVRLASLNRGIHLGNRSVIEISNAEVKNQGMIDATDQAAKIKEAASKTLIAQLFGEAKDKVDDKIKEENEKAAEKAEKEKDKKAEEAKRKEEEAKTAAEDVKTDSSQPNDLDMPTLPDMDQVQNEIKSMVANGKLLEEDLKGLLVDTTV